MQTIIFVMMCCFSLLFPTWQSDSDGFCDFFPPIMFRENFHQYHSNDLADRVQTWYGLKFPSDKDFLKTWVEWIYYFARASCAPKNDTFVHISRQRLGWSCSNFVCALRLVGITKDMGQRIRMDGFARAPHVQCECPENNTFAMSRQGRSGPTYYGMRLENR